MVDIDLSQRPPLRLGVAANDGVRWYRDIPAQRIRGIDLSDVSRKSVRARRAHPHADVVADIDVVIAPDAATARGLLAENLGESDGEVILYVGTPAGLAGLVADIYALGIADGAVLIPGAPGVADLIRDAVMPALQAMDLFTDSASQALPA
ncbi:hypothetical protein ACRDU6_24185 [Mycolicibacterium sp. ELW1]|uniref:hypothetical protein n=1 Tax=Mycobacteriaceae TaxID=1762 RepID=UPI0011ED02B6|nr:hypothetical protein [Mycobacterium sp. ELW1]QEN15371.1 hypothetical protein D3H54_20710 [Mycobacterium sp. ELW1]